GGASNCTSAIYSSRTRDTWCLRCVGVSLIPMAIVCMLSNMLLLLPELSIQFLLEGHVTREATWATGLWGSGFLVLITLQQIHINNEHFFRCLTGSSGMLCQVGYSCVCLLAACCCLLVSATGLSHGPLCLYNSTSDTHSFSVAVDHSGYLYNRTLWSGVCQRPHDVVKWNVILFSVMGGGQRPADTPLCGQHPELSAGAGLGTWLMPQQGLCALTRLSLGGLVSVLQLEMKTVL
uniref:Uncharacterized protein n=1 Tax=Mastacembelus armatus TaxID=205130 RepID=A0A3Q3MPV6_9TELE